MPSMSERATRAHRARRLRASSLQRRMERTDESPSRLSVSSVPSTTLSVDTDYYTNRGRSSSIPPTPVTPTEPEIKLARSNSSRFVAQDMIDEDMPMDERLEIRKQSPYKSVVVTPSSVVSPVSKANSVDSSDDSRRRRRPQIPQSPKREKVSERHIRATSVDAADRGGGHLIPHENSIASTGGKSSVGRLATAISRNATRRPDKLNMEEKALWDVVQTSLAHQRGEVLAKRRVLERQLQESTSQVDKLRVHNLELQQDVDTTSQHLQNAKRQLQTVKAYQFNDTKQDKGRVKELEAQVTDLQRKYNAAVSLTELQQEEHDRSIRAIQRVMADVNAEKEIQVSALQEQIDELQDRMEKKEESVGQVRDIGSSDVSNLRARARRAFQLESEMEELKETLMQVEEERDQFQLDLDQKAGQIAILEQELVVIKNAVSNAKDKELSFVEVITQQRRQLIEKNQELNNALPPRAMNGKNAGEVEAVKKELDDRSTSLENAKKLILSLEVANGSMASDLRAKLKIKDEQVLALKAEAADRKRTIDSLATELKNLQNEHVETGQSDSKMQENQQLLAQKLETAIGDLQSATVVLESSGPSDQGAVDEIAVILCSVLMALKVSIQAMEINLNAEYSNNQARTPNRSKDLPSVHAREEVKKKEAKLRMMEASLRTAQGEVELMKLKNERLQLEKDQDEVKMEVEIRHLKDECKTNLEVLTRKEQELQVLRDSLELGDGVGYISGDESDDNEEDDQRAIALSPGASAAYSPSKAEALATLLAHSGSGVEISISSIEIEKMNTMVTKAERDNARAQAELKIEKESLANAKMIISSLEKANKTMLEDLRLRLQDSNTAIAALLDKSMVHENVSSDLKSELERVKAEKLQAEREHQDEIAKFKDEALVSALRLAAKEREIKEFSDDSDDCGEDKKEEE